MSDSSDADASNSIVESPLKESWTPRILVVDDNALAADTLVTLLEVIGWSAHSTYSARGAREYLEAHVADIILLDIGMPEMDGYAYVAELRKEKGLTIPIVALTGYGLTEDRQKALAAGFTAHLTKPVGVNELRETLIRVTQ